MIDAISGCVFGTWSPGIGDPTVMGWLTVLVYLAAALVAVRVARQGRFPAATRRRERLFWTVVAILLLALAVNKQLDLQSFLTAAGRCLARNEGWYANRRVVQVALIAGLVGASVIAALCLWRLMRGTLSRTAPAVLGVVFVMTFVGVRAVGFHHVDALLKLDLRHIRLNWLLEWTGPVLILLSGLRLLARPRLQPSRSSR